MLSFLAIMITSIMSVGAVFGAVNTMYASISSRTPEIAVLLTLGFKPSNVLLSFLAESAVIALVGGVLGCLLFRRRRRRRAKGFLRFGNST